MPNYMLDAIQGYNFVDNIYRQKKQDKLALEDREFQKQRIAKNDARQEKQDARQEKQDARTELQWGREDQQHNDQLALRDINAAEIEQIFGPDISANPQSVKKASGLLQDPVRTGKIIAAHEELSKHLAAGKTPPNELTTELVNLIGAEELSGRGGDDGLTRSVESVVPSNKPGEVMVGFNVTGKDGKTYQAPMTTGASADPADNQVQSIPVKKLIEWGNGGAASAKAIAIARAKLGDNSFLDAYKAARADVAKRQNELTDYEAKKKVDVRYRENKPVAAGRYGMYDPATGKFIPNPATQGLGGGEWVTDAEGNEHLVGGSGKGGKPQAVNINWNDDGTADVYDPNTRKVTRVRSEEVAEQQSAQMAEEWAQEQARGIMNPMPEDELIQAKQKEFYNKRMDGQQGQSPPAAVGNPPPAAVGNPPPATAASLLDKFVGPPKGTPDGKTTTKPSAEKTLIQKAMDQFNVPAHAPMKNISIDGLKSQLEGAKTQFNDAKDQFTNRKPEMPEYDNPGTQQVEGAGHELREKLKNEVLPAINKKIADSASEGVDFWTNSMRALAGGMSENVLRGAAETLDSGIRGLMAGGKTYQEAADAAMTALMTGDVDHFQFQLPADNGQARKPVLGQGHTTAADVMKRGINAASQVQAPGDRGYTRYPLYDKGYTTAAEGLVNFLNSAGKKPDFTQESPSSRYYREPTKGINK